jgi:hypothetical protein
MDEVDYNIFPRNTRAELLQEHYEATKRKERNKYLVTMTEEEREALTEKSCKEFDRKLEKRFRNFKE